MSWSPAEDAKRSDKLACIANGTVIVPRDRGLRSFAVRHAL